MQKHSIKRRKVDHGRVLIIKKVAEKHQKSEVIVKQVVDGIRKNEDIMADYIDAKVKLNHFLQSNLFTDAIAQLVPFN